MRKLPKANVIYILFYGHMACPVCRKSLNREDSSSQPHQSIHPPWMPQKGEMVLLRHLPVSSLASPRQDTALVTFSLLSVAVIIISVWNFFVFLFVVFNAFLHHVNRYQYRHLNSRLSSSLPSPLKQLHVSWNALLQYAIVGKCQTLSYHVLFTHQKIC